MQWCTRFQDSIKAEGSSSGWRAKEAGQSRYMAPLDESHLAGSSLMLGRYAAGSAILTSVCAQGNQAYVPPTEGYRRAAGTFEPAKMPLGCRGTL